MVARGDVETSASAAATRLAPVPSGPTHFRPFRNDDYKIISHTTSMLELSGFYWGAMTVEEAHGQLGRQAPGTFLIRDSRQRDTLFTLSYTSHGGPISVRINFQHSRFSLAGSANSFHSLFALLEYYMSSPKHCLVRPYRKVPVQPLQELCRKRIMELCDGERIAEIPASAVVRDFLRSFPYPL